MKTALTGLLTAFVLSLSAQNYTFPGIGKPEAQEISTTVDTLFAGMVRGHISPGLFTGKRKELTHEMLEYFKNRQGEGLEHQIINCYPVGDKAYRVMVSGCKAGVLQQVYTLDLLLQQGQAFVDLPLTYDTRNWLSTQVGTIRYYYDHDFDLKAAHAFDEANRRIAGKLGLQVDSFDFYLADNYQQIMHWLGLTYDRETPGEVRDGFNVEQTIFAIQHNEDFSHDLVHYYVYKVRTGPRNSYAEEGVAYYWGNAYYPDTAGQMISLDQLKTALRGYMAGHAEADLLVPFERNQRGLIGGAPEVSMRSTLSGIIAEAVEKKYGVSGILKLLNCGAGETDYFAVTQSLLGINTGNFNQRIAALVGK